MIELLVTACLVQIPDRCQEVRIATFEDMATCVGSAVPAAVEWSTANPRSQVAKMRCRAQEQAV